MRLRWGLCVATLVLVAAPPWMGSSLSGEAEPRGTRILVVGSEVDAQKALAAYRSGVPFARLVRERSVGPERDTGGYLGRIAPESLSPDARAALGETPRGGVSRIFRTEEGFAILQVVSVAEEQELEARAQRVPEAREVFKRGTDLARGGNLGEAVILLQQAVALNPEMPDAYFNLAIAERKLGRADAALAAMRRVVQLRPKDVEAYTRLGAWLFDRGDYEEAGQAFSQAATYQMDSADAWLGLAKSYQAAGKPQAAIPAYQQAILLRGRDDPALVRALFRVAMEAKDTSLALATARKLQTLSRGHEGFLALGEALLLSGETEAAIQEYEKAAGLAPSSATVQARLAAAHGRVGQFEKAVQHSLRALQLDPKNPDHYRSLAGLYEDQGRSDLAIVALRDGVIVAAGSPPGVQAEVAEQLAALYERVGMQREAARERQRVQALRGR